MKAALERMVGGGDVTGEILGFQKGGDLSRAWEKGTHGRSEEQRPFRQSSLLVSNPGEGAHYFAWQRTSRGLREGK